MSLAVSVSGPEVVALNVCPCGAVLPWSGEVHICTCGGVYEWAPIYAGMGDRAGVKELLHWPSWRRAS